MGLQPSNYATDSLGLQLADSRMWEFPAFHNQEAIPYYKSYIHTHTYTYTWFFFSGKLSLKQILILGVVLEEQNFEDESSNRFWGFWKWVSDLIRFKGTNDSHFR